jgi:hypothetical protein
MQVGKKVRICSGNGRFNGYECKIIDVQNDKLLVESDGLTGAIDSQGKRIENARWVLKSMIEVI